MSKRKPEELRSRLWFNDPSDPEMTGVYLERYLNYGLTIEELKDGNKPIIGIAQTGSDLSPCNRHHMELAKRVLDGFNAAGGTVMNQSGQAVEIITIWMAVYLTISLLTSEFMNWFNARMKLVER